MSLNWNLSEIDNHDEICYVGEGDERRLAGLTNALIQMTMLVGLGDITEANAREFYTRLKLLERLDGPFLHDTKDGKRTPYYITARDVLAHVGLATNVSDETRAAWLKRQMKYKLADFEWQFDREHKQAEAAA